MQTSNDHTLSDHTLSDHPDNVVPNDVKSAKWSDELGGSLTDIRTFTISDYMPVPFGNNEHNMIKLDRKLYF